MDAQTGTSKLISIDSSVVDKISKTLRLYNYETGGIIGADDDGNIVEFCFDDNASKDRHEYHPNTIFLSNIINEVWSKKDINFVGMVHSHFNNKQISRHDIAYARNIIKTNDMNEIIIGIVNVDSIEDNIGWYNVSAKNVISLKQILN